MEIRQALSDRPNRTRESIWAGPEAPRSIERIAEYRGKVYLALLHQERERTSVAGSRSRSSIFPKAFR